MTDNRNWTNGQRASHDMTRLPIKDRPGVRGFVRPTMNLDTMILNKLALALLLGGAAAQLTPAKWDTLRTKARSNNLDDADYKDISDNWTGRPTDFLETFDRNIMEKILAKAMGVARFKTDWRGQKKGNMQGAKRIIEKITTKDLKGMKTDGCGVVVEFLEFVKSPADVPDQCRQSYYDNLNRGYIREMTINHIPAKWIKEDGSKVIDALKAEAQKIARLNTDSFKEVMKNTDDICKLVPATTLTKIKGAYYSLVTPGCVAVMKNLATGNIAMVVRKLPSNLFAKYNGALFESTTRAITAEQLRLFASDTDETHAPCRELKLSQVSRSAIKSVTPQCFAGSYGTATTGTVPVGENLIDLPTDLFASYKTDDLDFVGRMDAADFQYLPSEALQVIFNSPDVIKSFPTGVIFPKKGESVTTTAELFSTIAEKSPEVAGQMLLTLKTTPDNVLIELEASMIENLSGILVNGNSISGNDIMAQIAKNRSNAKAIIATMTENANTHFCSTITSGDDYLNKLQWLRANASKKCRDALGFDTTDLGFIAKAPEFNKDPEAWKTFVEKYSTTEWNNADDGLMSVLIKSMDFCRALTEEANKHIFPSLNAKALSVIGGEAAKILRKFITADNVSKFSINVFSHFTHDEFAEVKMKLNDVTIAQFPALSTEVAAGQSVFAKLSEDEFKAIDDEHLTAMSPKQWAAVSPQNIATIDEAKMKLIQATNMTLITDAQLEALSETALIAMSVEQITQVGKDSSATLAAFDKVISKLEAVKTEALALRKTKPVVVPDNEGTSMWVWITISAVALVLIGGAVFFFVRK